MAGFFKKGDALFGFLKSGRNKKGELVFRPVLGRIGLLLSFLAVAGWLSAGFGVMMFVKHARGFDGGAYTDILFYPWRKEAYQKAWGDEFIERGVDLLQEGEVQEAIHLIRVGHGKSPTNLKGRLLVAEFYGARGRHDLACRMLRGGLPYAEDDLNYLRTTFRVLINNQEDEAVKEIAADILSGEPVLTPRTQITALAAANAHFHRGGYDQAEDLLVQYELTAHPEGRILLARIDWERGRRQAALDRLEALTDQYTDQDDVYVLLTRYYRELGDHTKAHNFAVMRQIANPLTAAPRVALLYSHHAAGELDQVQRRADQLLKEFSHDRGALTTLAEFAANVADVELCRRVFQTMDKSGFSLDLPALLLSEAHLHAGEYRETIRFLESHSRQSETFTEAFEPVLAGIYAVAYLGLGHRESGEMYLSQFLDTRHLRAENFLITSRRLLELGEKSLARRVVTHAYRADPLNQSALAELIRLDLEAGKSDELVANIQKLLTMRKPPRALLEESFSMLGRDDFLFLPERDDLLRSMDSMMRTPAGEVSLTGS